MKKLFNFLGFKTENELINMRADDDGWKPENTWPFPTGEKPVGPSNVVFSNASKPLEVDPRGLPLNSPGAKADAGKLRPWLVLGEFSNALEEVSKVGTAGAKKYTPNGWITVENGKERYMDAAMRHLLEIGKGNKYDDGPTGIYTKHISNAIWNLLAVLELEEREESTS
jgi:Domain of unknown function (DUF5664)